MLSQKSGKCQQWKDRAVLNSYINQSQPIPTAAEKLSNGLVGI